MKVNEDNQNVINLLDQMDIKYEVIAHEAAVKADEMNALNHPQG